MQKYMNQICFKVCTKSNNSIIQKKTFIKSFHNRFVSLQIICVVFVQYATCRTAKDFREIPETAGRLSQADYPSYNIIAPEGNANNFAVQL